MANVITALPSGSAMPSFYSISSTRQDAVEHRVRSGRTHRQTTISVDLTISRRRRPQAAVASAAEPPADRAGRPRRVALGEQRLGGAARPVRREQAGRDLRVEEREAPPLVDELDEGGEAGLVGPAGAVLERRRRTRCTTRRARRGPRPGRAGRRRRRGRRPRRGTRSPRAAGRARRARRWRRPPGRGAGRRRRRGRGTRSRRTRAGCAAGGAWPAGPRAPSRARRASDRPSGRRRRRAVDPLGAVDEQSPPGVGEVPAGPAALLLRAQRALRRRGGRRPGGRCAPRRRAAPSARTTVDVQTAPPWGSTSSPRTVSSSALALEPDRGRRARSSMPNRSARSAHHDPGL